MSRVKVDLQEFIGSDGRVRVVKIIWPDASPICELNIDRRKKPALRIYQLDQSQMPGCYDVTDQLAEEANISPQLYSLRQ